MIIIKKITPHFLSFISKNTSSGYCALNMLCCSVARSRVGSNSGLIYFTQVPQVLKRERTHKLRKNVANRAIHKPYINAKEQRRRSRGLTELLAVIKQGAAIFRRGAEEEEGKRLPSDEEEEDLRSDA